MIETIESTYGPEHGQIQVIVPFSATSPERLDAMKWTTLRWVSFGFGVTVAEPVQPGPWRKAAVQAGAAQSAILRGARVLIFADADVFMTDARRVCDAADHVLARGGWAMPAHEVWRMTQAASLRVVLQHDPTTSQPTGHWLACESDERHRLHPGGGLTVMSTLAYMECPPDPRFEGWGHEDDAWSYALHCLMGPPRRAAGTLYHLWHPPQDRVSRLFGSEQNRALYARYADARRDPETIKAIIDEWRVAPDA
jgi:hypothetical protein